MGLDSLFLAEPSTLDSRTLVEQSTFTHVIKLFLFNQVLRIPVL